MSSSPLLLDTHVWFRMQVVPGALRPAAAAAIEAAAETGSVFVPLISIWELAMLERDHRIELQGGVARWTSKALSQPGLHLLAYSPAIAIQSVKLPAPMHKDPCDRVIVASALVEGMTLVTSDKALLAFAKQSALPHIRA